MNQPSLQQEMSTYADVKARCARIVTRLEAIATDPNATPVDPRDLFIRLELLSHELRGASFRVRECWWPTSNGGAGRDASVLPSARLSARWCQILRVLRPQGSASAELRGLGHTDTSVPLMGGGP
jgi:hypothetical protein